MVRFVVACSVLALTVAAPAAAEQQSVPKILERLHDLCGENYKPAYIKLGFVIARLPPMAARKLRRDHPDWWWWERW